MKKKLNENTSNFISSAHFPIYAYDLEYDINNSYLYDSDYPEMGADEEKEAFKDKWMKENVQFNVLPDEDYRSMLQEINSFNNETIEIASEYYDTNLDDYVALKDLQIEENHGYFSGEQLYIEYEFQFNNLSDEVKEGQLKRFKTFLKYLGKKYNLTVLEHQGTFDSGETVYKQVEESKDKKDKFRFVTNKEDARVDLYNRRALGTDINTSSDVSCNESSDDRIKDIDSKLNSINASIEEKDKIISLANEYEENCTPMVITQAEIKEFSDKLGLSEINSLEELSRLWKLSWNVLSKKSFEDTKNYSKWEDAASAFSEIINTRARELKDNLKEEIGGDKRVVSYNKGLALAKEINKPVVYGYTKKEGESGKFHPLEPKEYTMKDNEFRKKYKANVIYIAYPDKPFVEKLLDENNSKKDWNAMFRDFLEYLEFELVPSEKEKGSYQLIDLQGVNLGNIEDETFDEAIEIRNRLSTYIYDYFLEGFENTFDVSLYSCLYDDNYEMVLDLLRGKEEYEWDYNLFDFLQNHIEEVDLEKVVADKGE